MIHAPMFLLILQQGANITYCSSCFTVWITNISQHILYIVQFCDMLNKLNHFLEPQVPTVRAERKTHGSVDSLLSVFCNKTLKQPVVVLFTNST